MDEYSYFLRGEIDVSNADEQFALVRAASRRHSNTVTIDCMDLLFIDAAGLHALVTLSNELREHGRDLRLVHVSPFHRRLLDILELTELLADPDEQSRSIRPRRAEGGGANAEQTAVPASSP